MNALLEAKLIRHTGRGRQHYSQVEADNKVRSFWQSRATRTGHGAAPFPQLTNLPEMARVIRRTWQP